MTHKISVVVSWCDFFQEAARELGEGSFVLVQSMGPEDTLRQMFAHDAHHVHDVQDVYDAPSSMIARDVDFSSSQAWHSVSLFFMTHEV